MLTFDRLLQIDKNFQTAVNLRLDRESEEKIRGYIPTASSVALLHRFLENVAEERGQRASVLIGPYGKGKSHLLLVLLALLEQRLRGSLEEVLGRVEKVDDACRHLADKVMEKGAFLPVLVSDNGGSLNTSFLLALKEALDRAGLSELMPDSYYGEAVKCIERWRKDFPNTYEGLEEWLRKNTGCGEKNPARQLEKQLQNFKEEALRDFQKVYPLLTAGTQFAPLIGMEAVMLFQEVNRKLCVQYGYQGIYVVFDEFGKYVEGRLGAEFAADMKILQDMCELANADREERFFITFVVHKSLREYGGRFSKEQRNQWRGVEGRLQEYLFVESARNYFDLVGHVLRKSDCFEKEYQNFLREPAVKELLRQTYQLPFFQTQFSEENYEEIARSCFPLTPLAASLLLAMCEKIAQNERTLFTFLAGEEPNSLYHRIYHGEAARTGYLGAAVIYDYFAPAMRELKQDIEIHNEWLKAEFALHRVEDEDCRELIKVMTVLLIGGNRQELPVSRRNLSLAAGWEEERTGRALELLLERQLLLWRSRMGCYAFKNNVGINLDEELEKALQKLPARLNLPEQLGRLSELEYLLPKGYNQEYSMTRYFHYIFLTPQILTMAADTSYFFREKFSDGKLLAVLWQPEADREAIIGKSREWNDSRILIILPRFPFRQEGFVRKILALESMLTDSALIEENRVIEQELKLYREDLLFELNAALEEDFLPQNGRCEVFWKGAVSTFESEKKFNAFLSKICGDYYCFSPRVNHELLNIQNVTGQYLKARSHVVEDILSGKPMEQYERGTSPEAMVYRAALLRTGVFGGRYPADIGMQRILQEIRQFILACSGKRKCFAELFEKLQGQGYGVRKGLAPLLLAVEFTAVAGMPIIYLQVKEMNCNAEILNNISERPEQYYLRLEEVDSSRETYLAQLELFLDIRSVSLNKRQRAGQLTAQLQRRFRSLPQVVSNWKVFDREAWERVIGEYAQSHESAAWESTDAQKLYQAALRLMTQLKRLDVNVHELLFDRIPEFLGREHGDEACAQAVEIIFLFWQRELSLLQRELADKCLLLWKEQQGESLSGCLNAWYQDKRNRAERSVLGEKARGLCRCVEHMAGCSNEDAASRLAKAVSGIYMEDWSPDTEADFLRDIAAAREEIEGCVSGEETAWKGKKFAFTDEEGHMVERYFQPEETGIGDFLKNAIREAMDEFGGSMETGQKVAVLVEMLEELVK